MKYFKIFVCFAIATLPIICQAQLGDTYDIDRPKKYEDKKIGYEYTYTKKYALPRKFIQNTTSHYNFYFNANEKVKDIIARAKETQKDTFDRLLNYYSYNLNDTKSQKLEVDSVLTKASTGILIHDLRSNWVDNFYLLIGKAYLLKKEFDSAEMTFNFINYEYGKRNKDKERVLTGSSENATNNAFSIATKESKNIAHKLVQRPPSRNEAFIWMIRTYIENNDFGSAAGLVETLKNDPLFPKRLENDLDELTGFMYYKQNVYDSAAVYIIKSLSKSDNKNDKARREFLAAQLYELANNNAKATEYYADAVKHTLDPVMEVFARLYALKLNKNNDPKLVNENIAALVKMARKDAYTDYRDIIYYFAAKMELEQNQLENATTYFVKSTTYATTNIAQKNKSYLALAEIAFTQKKYQNANNYYDSIVLSDASLKNIEEINSRKITLKKLVQYINTTNNEDSLQTIAKMTKNDRDDYIKKLLKRLRKEQGLKEEVNFGSGGAGNNFADRNAHTSLFEPSNGDWYFYNSNQKTRGFNEFKTKWGSRPNIDGWRLSSNLNGGNGANRNTNTNATTTVSATDTKVSVADLTPETLLANVPLTDSVMLQSNAAIYTSLLATAKLYQYELDATNLAVETYENLLRRFANNPKNEEVLYNLYLAYSKLNNVENATRVKKLLDTKYPNSTYNPKASSPTNNKIAATKAYNNIYDLFVAGKFEEAIALKKEADKLYSQSLWSQQLLYIESIYYIKQRQDSIAMVRLDNTINVNATTPMAMKAITLREVLARRGAIEKELTDLKVTKQEETVITIDSSATVKPIIKPTPTTTTTAPVVVNNKPVVIKDTATQKPMVTAPQVPSALAAYPYKVDSVKQHYVAVILKKVDNIFVNELRNGIVIYNRGTGRTLSVTPTGIDAEYKLMLVGNFTNAADAINYKNTIQPKMSNEIAPWLVADKYSIVIITEENLGILQKDKDVVKYANFIKILYPGKF